MPQQLLPHCKSTQPMNATTSINKLSFSANINQLKRNCYYPFCQLYTVSRRYSLYYLRREELQGSHGYKFLRLHFLATAYEFGWPVLSLTVSSLHRQCAISVLTIAEFARRCSWSRNLKPNLCPGHDLSWGINLSAYCIFFFRGILQQELP